MQVDLIAQTRINPLAMRQLGFEPDGRSDIDSLAEFAGRSCYQSFHRPNPATADVVDYLAHIIEVGHFSVLEHGSVTFYITGVSRSLTHELVRHRHFSFSQVSQRYVDEENGTTVIPPVYGDWPEAAETVATGHRIAQRLYADLVLVGERAGLKRKQARQAARSVLPNATETKIVVTGNLRAWREFLSKRWHVAADDEIRDLAGLILAQLVQAAPGSVQDVPVQPYGTHPDGPRLSRGDAAHRLLKNGMAPAAVSEALNALFPEST